MILDESTCRKIDAIYDVLELLERLPPAGARPIPAFFPTGIGPGTLAAPSRESDVTGPVEVPRGGA